jgi:putative two-component system protein, hydrogenase maturation factor HypX/HoxX
MTTHAGLARSASSQPDRFRTLRPARRSLDVLFLVSAHNSLSQRAYIELSALGHDVSVAVVGSAADMEAAVAKHQPELIVGPMLKKRIPESIWSATRCLIVHPGPMGDRGPSSLDWAIETGASDWGVIVLEANDDFDAGDVWATRTFAMRPAGKSSVYRHEVRRAAVEALSEAVEKVATGASAPPAVTSTVSGRERPLMKQEVRAIDWSSDPTDTVVRKIRAAEGHPGVLDTLEGLEFHLFGVHPERGLRGPAGAIIAQRDGAICRATVDGAVWITHLKRRAEVELPTLKLPAIRALSLAGRRPDVPEVPAPLHAPLPADHTHRELTYEEHGGVGYLRFDFYNGAMSTEQCGRLLEAYQYARSRTQTKVIALMGGSDYFSNGIHLNVIEAADNPALESWSNLNAMNDLVREIVVTDSHLVLSALRGDTAAGGVPLALAADHVVAREDVVLNPYYGHMGGLYGSEYWTYLLPRRVGQRATARLTSSPFTPIGTQEAVSIGLLDAAFGATAAGFEDEVRRLAGWLASPAGFSRRLEEKRRRRARDEQRRPLEAYRADEMARSHECFFGADRSYHEARRRFAYKLG